MILQKKAETIDQKNIPYDRINQSIKKHAGILMPKIKCSTPKTLRLLEQRLSETLLNTSPEPNKLKLLKILYNYQDKFLKCVQATKYLDQNKEDHIINGYVEPPNPYLVKSLLDVDINELFYTKRDTLQFIDHMISVFQKQIADFADEMTEKEVLEIRE